MTLPANLHIITYCSPKLHEPALHILAQRGQALLDLLIDRRYNRRRAACACTRPGVVTAGESGNGVSIGASCRAPSDPPTISRSFPITRCGCEGPRISFGHNTPRIIRVLYLIRIIRNILVIPGVLVNPVSGPICDASETATST